jgi:ribosome-associated protein
MTTDDAERYLRVTPALSVPLDELEWRFGPSGGPGGQHANRAHTRAEVRFDIATSPSLDEPTRARLLATIGPTARASADDARSQLRNRATALDRLRSTLAAGAREQRPRRKTRPRAGAIERRLQAKRRRGELKRSRRSPDAGW